MDGVTNFEKEMMAYFNVSIEKVKDVLGIFDEFPSKNFSLFKNLMIEKPICTECDKTAQYPESYICPDCLIAMTIHSLNCTGKKIE